MAFVDALKEKLNKTHPIEDDDDYDIADAIRKDPKYRQVIDKLRDLAIKREELLRALRKIEIDIDACLVIISIGKEKEEIDKTQNQNYEA